MSAPREIDVSGFPILCRHWPNFPSPVERDSAPDTPPHIRDLQLRRDVERLHRLGPRATYELLQEIGRQRQCMTFVEDSARRAGALDPVVLARLGGDRFPAAPLYEVKP